MPFALDEVRRLTGPNLLSDYPGAIADVFFNGIDAGSVITCWQQHLTECAKVLNWPPAPNLENSKGVLAPLSFSRVYKGGGSVSIAAPMDLLYSACDLLELAWDLCVAQLSAALGETPCIVERSARLQQLQQSMQQERNPKLIALLKRAEQERVLCLVDDDEFSLGAGSGSRVWSIDELPAPDDIVWGEHKDIPLALITGTNGKSTSVRLAAEIAKAMGIVAGVTSTDFIKVGDTIIDEGDYSGPGGARMLLRDKRTQMAFLEVARGGLLRRGLPVTRANAALVTNVASDHLGQYGINTVDEITQVKMMVAKSIQSMIGTQYAHGQAMLVLNADDHRLAQAGLASDSPICWFSTSPTNPLIVSARAKRQPCVFIEQNKLVYSAQTRCELAYVDELPMTMQGTAMHNVQNALGVIGLCKILGIDDTAISKGLTSFGSDAKDNPGRGNVYNVKGITVIVDFAHNSHSMQALINMAAKMPAKHTHVMFSHAGDRSDQEIKDVSDAVYQLSPKTYCLSELAQYLRGRELGDISTIVQRHLLNKGVSEEAIVMADNPLAGSKQLLSIAQPGDLVLLFVLSNREKVERLIQQTAST